MFVYVCYGGEMVKSNGLIEYKGGRVITEIMNVHIPYVEFVSIVCDRLKFESTALKMYYACKFDQSMLVWLEDDAEMRKMFKFNDKYCYAYASSNSYVSIEVIQPPPRYVNFSSKCDFNTTSHTIWQNTDSLIGRMSC